jgi:hydrogenase maturation protease
MTVIAAIGTAFGGDDSLGLVVAGRLRDLGRPVIAVEPVGLLGLFTRGRRVVIADALVGAGLPGEVLHVTGPDLRRIARRHRVSSHGLGLGEALDLAEALEDGSTEDTHLVGIVVPPPSPVLTPLGDSEAQKAVNRAVALICSLAG